MLDALRLIIKNGALVLFVTLQLICFYWIIHYNQRQKQIYFYSSQLYANKLSAQYQRVNSYFHLKNDNDSLVQENSKLMQKYLSFLRRNDAISNPTDSSLLQYQIIPAMVVNNNVAKRNNTITLDKGWESGVTAGMGVISSSGIVGIVTDVSEHFSLVMSLLHSKSRISCKLPRSGFFGALTWDGKDPAILQLEDIQRYADIRKEDSIVTSGFSIIFPPDILVGKINEFTVEPGAFTYSISVEPTQSFYKLDRVYIINHSYKEEKSLLEQKSESYE